MLRIPSAPFSFAGFEGAAERTEIWTSKNKNLAFLCLLDMLSYPPDEGVWCTRDRSLLEAHCQVRRCRSNAFLRPGRVKLARVCFPTQGCRSVPCHLRGLAIRALVGGLDEHGLRDVLACRHGHLLDLVELLADRRRGREVSSHAAPLWARSLSSSQACVKSVPGTRP